MAYHGYGPVQTSEVQEASRTIQASLIETRLESAVKTDLIGSRFNEWRRPIADYGRNNPEWEVKLKTSTFVGDIELGSKKEWAAAREIVDTVLKLMLKEIIFIADTRFKGLKLERYIRQGSARDGLKVVAPDEFDTLLQFHFEEMSVNVVVEQKNGKLIPEFCRIEVNQSMAQLESRLPDLFKAGAFYPYGGKIFLNANKMYEGVFQSLIDSATLNISKKIQEVRNSSFTLARRTNPPSLNITIDVKGAAPIDVDIVPGLLIRNDRVADARGVAMDCPVYAVIKSVSSSDFQVPNIIWRMCSSGYEKHTLDMAQFDQKKRYIVTALRILKTYFTRTKTVAKANNQSPPQITTVLRSYFLKHIAFYLILYLCYINPDVIIGGVEDALLYFVDFLSVVLKTKSLPHFFHSNHQIRLMYPDYPISTHTIRFNLLRSKSSGALEQAKMSLDNHLMPNLGFSFCGSTDTRRPAITSSFSKQLSSGEYF